MTSALIGIIVCLFLATFFFLTVSRRETTEESKRSFVVALNGKFTAKTHCFQRACGCLGHWLETSAAVSERGNGHAAP